MEASIFSDKVSGTLMTCFLDAPKKHIQLISPTDITIPMSGTNLFHLIRSLIFARKTSVATTTNITHLTQVFLATEGMECVRQMRRSRARIPREPIRDFGLADPSILDQLAQEGCRFLQFPSSDPKYEYLQESGLE